MVSTANIPQSNTNTVAQPQKMSVGFMKEDNGNFSSMRLMSLIALISAIRLSLALRDRLWRNYTG